MSTLFIDRRDARLEAERGTLTIRGGDGSLLRAPLAALERVVLRGPALVTTGAIGAIAAQGASLLVLAGKHGAPAGTFLGPGHADATIRLGQFAFAFEAKTRGLIAAEVVRRKLIAQARLLRAAQAQRPDRRLVLRRGAQAVGAALARLRSEPIGEVARLSGLEGAAAVAYFEAYASLLPPSLGFVGRNRRPPRDPVNAVLSLAYTLATAEAAHEAHVAGLDPALGFLHAPAPGRPSLACDLVEPLRPVLDRLVWRLFAEEVLRGVHFTRDGEACLLGKAGRLAFYAAWEEAVGPARRLMRRGLRPLVRACRARGAALWGSGDAADPAS
jgi:CRISPR-associated protein Cas1